MAGLSIKTQTRRNTQYKENIINFNCFVGNNLEIGVITSKYWGDFEEREEPLIDLTIEGVDFSIPKSKFINMMKRNLKGKYFKS